MFSVTQITEKTAALFNDGVFVGVISTHGCSRGEVVGGGVTISSEKGWMGKSKFGSIASTMGGEIVTGLDENGEVVPPTPEQIIEVVHEFERVR